MQYATASGKDGSTERMTYREREREREEEFILRIFWGSIKEKIEVHCGVICEVLHMYERYFMLTNPGAFTTSKRYIAPEIPWGGNF